MANGGKRPGAGRPKGIPNKVTADVRATIAAFAKETVADLEDRFKKIDDPAKWVDLWARVVEYHIPKLQRVERTISDATDEELLAEVRRRREASDE